MSSRKFLKGKVFGKLLVLEDLPTKKGYSFCLVKCLCGIEKSINASSLIRGLTKTCGNCRSKHGYAYHPLYHRVYGMMERCLNPKHPKFKYYGGREIPIEFRFGSIGEAIKYIIDNLGYPPPSNHHSIDRRENNGHYEPGNLRYATQSKQLSNRRTYPKSGKKGVTVRLNGKFTARIKIKGRSITLGTFKTIEEASKAFNKKHKEIYENC